MSKFKGARWAALIVVSMATTGTALAQQSPDQSQSQPYQQNPPYQQPTTTEDQTKTEPQQPSQTSTVIVTPPVSTQAPVNYQQVPTNYPSESEEGPTSTLERIGFALSVGGGFSQFTNHQLRDTTGTAGTWTVRATIGSKSPLGFEGSYIGSAQSINALGLSRNATLVGNGAQGVLRLNAPIGVSVMPFLFGGAAWTHYTLRNVSFNTSDIESSDNVLEFPVGLGIGGSWNHFAYDVRGEMRFATNADLVPEVSAGRDTGDHADMHRWGVNATIGYEF